MDEQTQPKVAVVGGGNWGDHLIRHLHALGALGAICHTNPQLAENHTAQYPGTTFFQSYKALLQDDTIQGVFLATPAATHAIMAREALLAGKDVCVEKPFCLSEEEGYQLVTLAEECGRLIMVGHLLSHHPIVLHLKGMIERGELGPIRYIYSNRFNPGKLHGEEDELWSSDSDHISVILGLTNQVPEHIQANGGHFLPHQIADATMTLLSFANGIRAHIFVSCLHPYQERQLVVAGEKQMVIFNDTLPWQEKLQCIPVLNKAAGEYVVVPQADPVQEECQHFLTCICTRQRPHTHGQAGIRLLQVVNGCKKALESGERVTMKAVSPPVHPDVYIHPSAMVDDLVTIGKGTKIWHFSHILGNSKVGEKCNVGQNVVIGPGATVGNGCKIQNNVSVYERVTLEEDVFCGPSMVFTNVINPRAHIPRKHEYRATLVKRGATIGANATIVCGITLGRYSMIGAGSVVIRDVADHALMVGNPARQIGWVCECGIKLDESLRCTVCQRQYHQLRKVC